MRLYSYYRSSCSWRVRIALAHKEIAYDYIAVNIRPGVDAQKSQRFADVNEMRQVPVLEIDEPSHTLRLTQSVAICEYLEERFSHRALLPSDLQSRARVRELVEIITSGIQPLQNLAVLQALRTQSGEQAAQAVARGAIAQGLSAFHSRVQTYGGRYAMGDTPTLADVFLIPQLYNARRFDVDLSGLPRLVEIEAQANQLPAFIAAHPDRQPDAPHEEERIA